LGQDFRAKALWAALSLSTALISPSAEANGLTLPIGENAPHTSPRTEEKPASQVKPNCHSPFNAAKPICQKHFEEERQASNKLDASRPAPVLPSAPASGNSTFRPPSL